MTPETTLTMKQTTLILFFFSLTFSFSQFKYPEKKLAVDAIQKTLAVQLLDESSESERFANQALKTLFGKEWKLTPVEFMTKEKIEDFINAGSSNYAYLTQSDRVKSDIRTRYITMEGKMFAIGAGPANSRKDSYAAFTFSYYSFDLAIYSEKGKLENVTSIGFANGELSKIDYLFLAQQLTHLLESAKTGTGPKVYYDIDENIKRTKNTTLVLPKAFFKEKDQGKIKSYYKEKFELVDWETYQNTILGKDPNKSYVKITWSNQHELYLWLVVNAQDGHVLSQMGFGGVKFGKHHDANDIIKVKHLQYITNKKAQKFNNRYK